MNTDPISAAIDAAVQRAIEAQIPNIIEAIKQASRQPATEPDRFYPILEAAKLLGKSPSTIWRLERKGEMPPRERMGGTVGYRASTIKNILDGVSREPIPAPAKALEARATKRSERRGRRPLGNMLPPPRDEGRAS